MTRHHLSSLLSALCSLTPRRGILHALALSLGALVVFAPHSAAASELRLLRVLETHDHVEAPDVEGIAFPHAAGTLLRRGEAGLELLLIADEQVASTVPLGDAVNVAFDADHGAGGRLYVYDARRRELVAIDVGAAGHAQAGSTRRIDAAALELGRPGGMALDPGSHRLFILDAVAGHVVVLTSKTRVPDPRQGQIAIWPLPPEVRDPRGLAFNAANGQLYVWSEAAGGLCALRSDGQLRAVHALAELEGQAPIAVEFAASSDRTDDPSERSLYVATERAVSEWTLVSLSAATAEASLVQAAAQATLVRTIHTSQFSPPSPDPAGLTYVPTEDRVLVSDSEVNEMSIYRGSNVFEMTRAGNLRDSWDTTDYSDEPTGLAFDVSGDRLFVSDDNGDDVYELRPGNDGQIGTADDDVTEHDARAWGSSDPEGVAYADGVLWIGDGSNAEVVKVLPGRDGEFGTSDDQSSHFDTSSQGVTDAEGITIDAANGHLYVSGKPNDVVGEFTLSGSLIRLIDISEANARLAAGLTWAPSTLGGGQMALYVSDRGVDNGSDPRENDGRVFEFVFDGVGGGNAPPSVDAGPDRTIAVDESAQLDGAVDDDGKPEDPGVTTSRWTQRSGPGSVQFADPNAPVTSATFTEAGTYVLRLTANDGELEAFDEMTVTVTTVSGGNVIDVRIVRGSDDAEERDPRRRANLGRGMLALGDQLVGVRFDAVQIPQGASIASAYIQFQADGSADQPSLLEIRIQSADDAPTFARAAGNISQRSTTGNVVAWPVAAWSAGDSGSAQRTPDLSQLVQAIVARGGWQAGNAMVFVLDGAGKRTAESYEGNAAAAALLHVEWE